MKAETSFDKLELYINNLTDMTVLIGLSVYQILISF